LHWQRHPETSRYTPTVAISRPGVQAEKLSSAHWEMVIATPLYIEWPAMIGASASWMRAICAGVVMLVSPVDRAHVRVQIVHRRVGIELAWQVGCH